VYPKTLGKKLLRNYRDYGLWILIRKSAANLFKPVFENVSMILYRINLENIPEKQAETDGFEFKLLDAEVLDVEDVNLIDEVENMEEWLWGQLAARLHSNSICMVLLKDGELVGLYLASFRKTINPLLKMKVLMGPLEVWGEQITISKAYRGRGLAGVLKHRVYGELKARGIKSVYGISRKYNWASLRSAGQFHPAAWWAFKYLKIFGFRRLICRHMLAYRPGPEDKKDRRRVPFRAEPKAKKVLWPPSSTSDEYYFVVKTSSFPP